MTVREIAALEDMPAQRTIFQWLAKNPEFAQQYTIAHDMRLEAMAEEIIEISDDGRNDWIERQVGENRTETVADHEHINRSRLRVDTRKWLLSKLAPKKYGDKMALTGDGGGALIIKWQDADDNNPL
jgi:hypothetical protein